MTNEEYICPACKWKFYKIPESLVFPDGLCICQKCGCAFVTALRRKELESNPKPPPAEKMIDLPNKDLLRVGEVAEYFTVTPRTVYQWIEDGHLETKQTPAGQVRVTRKSVDKFRLQDRKDEKMKEIPRN